MRALVIGASGFLGTAVVRELTARGVEVVGSSRSRPGYYALDITDPAACRRILARGGFETVLNLAATGVTSGTSTDDEMSLVNSTGAAVLARAMSELAAPPWFVHVSSSTEPTSGDAPESTYSATKAQGTAATTAELNSSGLAHAIVRIHNTYGPGQPEGRFVMGVLTKLRRGESFLVNYPERVREFCFVPEVARHLADVLENPGEGAMFREIGSGVGLTLQQAARVMSERVGARADLVTARVRTTPDPHARQVADSGSPDFLACTTSFRDGIDAVVRSLEAAAR